MFGLACLVAEKTMKNYPKTPNQTKPPDFDTFLQISQLRVFCAVILNTINQTFVKKNISALRGVAIFFKRDFGSQKVKNQYSYETKCL